MLELVLSGTLIKIFAAQNQSALEMKLFNLIWTEIINHNFDALIGAPKTGRRILIDSRIYAIVLVKHNYQTN